MTGGHGGRRRGCTLGYPERCFSLRGGRRHARFLRRLLQISEIVLLFFTGRTGQGSGGMVSVWAAIIESASAVNLFSLDKNVASFLE